MRRRGVAGVDDQIEQGQLQLGPIRRHRQVAALQIKPQIDQITHRPRQQFADARDEIRNHEGLDLELPGAGEGEQLAGQFSPALGRLNAAFGQLLHLPGVAGSALDELERALNSLQQIIEIMRDPAR